MTAHLVLTWTAAGFLVAGALLATYRIVKGPTILDRMIASDVLLTTTMIALAMLMVLESRTDLIPVLLVLAASAAFATVAVARSVSRHDRSEQDPGRPDPLSTIDDAEAVLERAQEDVAALDDDRLDDDRLEELRPGREGA